MDSLLPFYVRFIRKTKQPTVLIQCEPIDCRCERKSLLAEYTKAQELCSVILTGLGEGRNNLILLWQVKVESLLLEISLTDQDVASITFLLCFFSDFGPEVGLLNFFLDIFDCHNLHAWQCRNHTVELEVSPTAAALTEGKSISCHTSVSEADVEIWIIDAVTVTDDFVLANGRAAAAVSELNGHTVSIKHQIEHGKAIAILHNSFLLWVTVALIALERQDILIACLHWRHRDLDADDSDRVFVDGTHLHRGDIFAAISDIGIWVIGVRVAHTADSHLYTCVRNNHFVRFGRRTCIQLSDKPFEILD